jgi:hypothetical protein
MHVAMQLAIAGSRLDHSIAAAAAAAAPRVNDLLQRA